MKVYALEITDPHDWEKFISQHPESNFLASYNWGLFHQALGKKVYYRGYYLNQDLKAVALFVKETAKRGTHFTIAGGPILDFSHSELFQAFVLDARQFCLQEKVRFLRIRPQITDSPQIRQTLKKAGFIKAPMHLEAELTIQLDTTKPLETLLQEMRKNTRYEIKKAQKLGLQITTSDNPREIDQFYQHQLTLARKHGFVPFARNFLFQQFKIFAQSGQALLFHAFHKNQLLASAFIIFYGQEAVYHYGISTPANRKLPGAYAVLWAAIKETQKRGLSRFNLWGIAPDSKPNHRFRGVTTFKKGFGGQVIAYVPAHDLPIKSSYWFTYWFETLRSKLRHLS